MANQNIKITPIRDPSGKVTGWDMDYNNHKGSKNGSYPSIDLPKNSGNHEFLITIKNAKGVVFAPGTSHPTSGDNALWIAQGNDSPTVKGIDPQITGVRLHNPTQLEFTDINNGKDITLGYRLNFTGAPSLDPIIKNGGGTGPGATSELYAAAALLLAALVGFVLWRRMKARDEKGPGNN